MNLRLSPIEAARARHPLADVAARTGVPLPQGLTNAVTVRCPMPEHGHPDRTPSLRLFLDEGIWYCFGCSQRGGDVVQWVMQTEGVGCQRAIEILDSGQSLTNAWATAVTATDWGIRQAGAVVRDNPDLGRTSPARVQEAIEAAWDFYTGGPRHPRAVAYLGSRRIDVTALERYTGRAETGSTPSYGMRLVDHLRSAGFNAEELIDAGLAHGHSDGQISDFYRQRILVPIRSPQGHLVGLVGRNVGDQRWVKYKNPPRTVLYDKSVDLYQPLPAPRSHKGRVIVVEGTLDAMAIAVAAVKTGTAHHFCPVTQSGRELSPSQFMRVIRLHPQPPVLAFDADPARREAALRHQHSARRLGRPVNVAELPPGHDPASWLAEQGPQALSAWMPDRPAFVPSFSSDLASSARSPSALNVPASVNQEIPCTSPTMEIM